MVGARHPLLALSIVCGTVQRLSIAMVASHVALRGKQRGPLAYGRTSDVIDTLSRGRFNLAMDRRKFLSSTAAVAGTVLASPDLAAAESASDASLSNPNARSVRMITANELVVTYLSAWNETDTRRRRELVAKTWTEAGSYVDAHRRGEGHAGIDSMIENAQRQFSGYRLRLVSKIEAHNGYIRFSWAAGGSEQAPLYLGGTDFGVTAGDGRLQSVTGFVDAAPAPAAP